MKRAIKLILICGSVGFLAQSCAVKRESSRSLEYVGSAERLTSREVEAKLVNKFYGDTLKGNWTPDTTGADSTEVESAGIRMKVKATKTPKGTRFDFTAIAKPVARSELNTSSKTTDHQKNAVAVQANESDSKKTNSFTGWVWLGLALVAIGLLILFLPKLIRKFLTPRKWK
ncbi:hypothetical protein [Pedobacter zeae]|uniref:Uncharacterized protein n=1 Tax=Pedobacter zeae TaxID=1737356 RepID=A0A7W6K9B0_9SPHI|nr:hypothetical protein [Pedobacter zeae]MBB4106621.1 hypothetical protein [Pedobacter zeae]GGH02762.1 hypothetical protein GCM10007422_17410 [Pedobacter zeae]